MSDSVVRIAGAAAGKIPAVGSRAQVFHGTAKHTPGGLVKSDLFKGKDGRIKSKKASAKAKKLAVKKLGSYLVKKGSKGFKLAKKVKRTASRSKSKSKSKSASKKAKKPCKKPKIRTPKTPSCHLSKSPEAKKARRKAPKKKVAKRKGGSESPKIEAAEFRYAGSEHEMYDRFQQQQFAQQQQIAQQQFAAPQEMMYGGAAYQMPQYSPQQLPQQLAQQQFQQRYGGFAQPQYF